MAGSARSAVLGRSLMTELESRTARDENTASAVGDASVTWLSTSALMEGPTALSEVGTIGRSEDSDGILKLVKLLDVKSVPRVDRFIAEEESTTVATEVSEVAGSSVSSEVSLASVNPLVSESPGKAVVEVVDRNVELSTTSESWISVVIACSVLCSTSELTGASKVAIVT